VRLDGRQERHDIVSLGRDGGEPMITKGAHHVSLDVRDVAVSRAFYGELLGLPEIERPEIGLPGAWYQAGAVQLHLIQVPEGVDVGRPAPQATPLANHLAFEIDDPAAAQAELEAAGYAVISFAARSGQLFVADPDGNMIEFIRPPR
jgi:catechol 2,3-dioxygenase-like lactoylglutathione lyase family enzyme